MKIVLFGDSITDMARNRDVNAQVGEYGFGYPFFVAGELLSEDPKGYKIYNRGISGDRTVDLYARIKRDVWNIEPDVLSILIGINDIWHDLTEDVDSANGVDIERFEKVYRMVIEDTLKRLPNLKIMLIEPFVLKGVATEMRYDEFPKVVKRLAEEYNLNFVPLQERFDLAAEKFGAEKYLYDGVHPTVAGAKLIADEWLKAFGSMVEKR